VLKTTWISCVRNRTVKDEAVAGTGYGLKGNTRMRLLILSALLSRLHADALTGALVDLTSE
jgi:hypothetical protein